MSLPRGEQLEWERRRARPAALCAFASVLLMIAAFVYLTSSISGPTEDAADRLRTFDTFSTELLIGSVLTAISNLLLAPVLWFLAQAARARRSDLPQIGTILAVIGPVLIAGSLVVLQLRRLDAVSGALANGALPTTAEAEAVFDDRGGSLLQGLAIAGSMSLAFAFVVVSLDALRTGLVSRFLGYLGIGAGALLIIPLFGAGPPIIEIFWLGAIGLILLDRWPNGRGRAWETGESVPWPTAAEQRAAFEQRRSGEAAASESPAAAEQLPTGSTVVGDGDATAPRKRKKRR